MSARTITPIVFWASLAPWASATSEPEPICATRKPRFRGPGRLLRNPQYTASMTIAATDQSEQRRGQRRESDAPADQIPADRARPGGHPGRPDQAADQRVRGRRGKAGPPGDEVPRDRADQRREQELVGDRVDVHDVLADRARDARRHERARRSSSRPPGPRPCVVTGRASRPRSRRRSPCRGTRS